MSRSLVSIENQQREQQQERGEKERKRDGEFSFRSTIFSFTLARKKKKKRRGGRWKEKKMRPNGFQGERRSKDGGAKVRWSIWAIKRKWTHWCIKIFLIYRHESMFFSFRIHVPYVENRITRNTVISYTKENLTEIVFYQC